MAFAFFSLKDFHDNDKQFLLLPLCWIFISVSATFLYERDVAISKKTRLNLNGVVYQDSNFPLHFKKGLRQPNQRFWTWSLFLRLKTWLKVRKMLSTNCSWNSNMTNYFCHLLLSITLRWTTQIWLHKGNIFFHFFSQGLLPAGKLLNIVQLKLSMQWLSVDWEGRHA